MGQSFKDSPTQEHVVLARFMESSDLYLPVLPFQKAALPLQVLPCRSLVQAPQGECLGLQQPSFSLGHNPCWFSQPDVMGIPPTCTGAPHSCGVRGTSAVKISLPSDSLLWLLYNLGYKSSIQLVFGWFSMMVFGWFFLVILMWEKVSTVSVTGSLDQSTFTWTSYSYYYSQDHSSTYRKTGHEISLRPFSAGMYHFPRH